MDDIRPFVEADIPEVARLHRAVFRTGDLSSWESDGYPAYFQRVFLGYPFRDSPLSSLVYQRDGRIVGFLGVVPRRMSLHGRALHAAVSSQLIVDPSARGSLAAVRLARAFLDGPQDLSIADEANEGARRIWEGLGGSTSVLHSLYWTRLLRPVRLALNFARTRPGWAGLARSLGPAARILDGLGARILAKRLEPTRPAVSAASLDNDSLLASLPELVGSTSLRVDYDIQTLHWLLERAERRKPGGSLRNVTIMNGRTVLGWYLYHLEPGGIAEVLQLAARTASIREVLDHLSHQAWRDGATAVAGRLEPRLVPALSDNHCFFHRRETWLLVHSDDQEVLRSFDRGDVFISRLDGEWTLGFPTPAQRHL